MAPVFALAALLAMAPLASAAETNSTALAWHCTQQFDRDFNIECIPKSAGATAAIDDLTAPASPSRNAGPAGHDMRPVAARGNAEVFSTRAWRVPLYSRPANAQAVSRLLESVLCDRLPDCTVHYAMDGSGNR